MKWRPLVAAAIAACASREPAPEDVPPATPTGFPLPAPPPRPELTAIVVSRDVRLVSSEVEGRVTLDVGIGDRVRAGALIAELDDAELRARLAAAHAEETTARGDVVTATAEVSQQARKLTMDERLAARGYASNATVSADGNELVMRKGRAQSAAGRYAAAKARRIEIERELAAADITSPSDGVVTLVKAKTGEIVHKGTQIAQVSDPDRLWLRFAVPPETQVHVGARVEAALEKAHPVRGTVRTITDTIVPPNHLLIVDADVDEPARVSLGATGKLWFLDGL